MQDFFLSVSVSSSGLYSVSPPGIISIMYFNGGLSHPYKYVDTLVYYSETTTTLLEPQYSSLFPLCCPDCLHGDNMFAHVNVKP